MIADTGADSGTDGPWFLAGGGETGALLRAHPWAATPLGAPETWPPALRSAVSLMLGSRQPVYIAWGRELTSLYNDGYIPILGAKHPGIGRGFADLWSEIWDEFRPVVEATLSGTGQYFVDQPIALAGRATPTGWFTYSWTPLRNDEGQIAGFYCAAQETTATVLAEHRQAAERERQRVMLGHMPGYAVLLSGPEHRLDYVNDACIRLAGRSDFIGLPIRDAFPALDTWGLYAALDRVHATGEAIELHATAIRLASGGERLVDLVLHPLRDEADRITGVFVGGHDVTEAMRAEAELRASEGRVRLLADAVPHMVWITAADGKNEFFNRQWAEYTGQSWGATAAEVAESALHPDDQHATLVAFQTALATGRTFEVEHRIRSKTGEYRWFLARAEPFRDPETGLVARWYGASLDIHDRKRTEDTLRESEARQAMLLALLREQRETADPALMMQAASEALGRHLGVDRVGFFEVVDEDLAFDAGWAGGRLPPLSGRLRVDGIGAAHVTQLRAGHTVAVADVRSDPLAGRPPAGKAHAVALVAAPILRGGRWHAGTYVHHAEPRTWSEQEVALVREVADRTWDAVERARAQAALRASERRSTRAIAVARLGTFDWELGSGGLTLDARGRELLAFPADGDQPRAEEVFERVHPDDYARVEAAIVASTDALSRLEVEFRIHIPGTDGGERTLVSLSDAVAGPDGRAARFVGVLSDVTERVRAEAALRESEAQLRLATEAAEVGLWDLDIITDVLFWPPRVKAMFGISPDAAISMADFYAGLHPEDSDGAIAAFATALDPKRRALYDVEYRTVGKEDGVIRWVAAKGRAIFDKQGVCVRVLGTAVDITARKAIEERLRELNDTLEHRVAERTAELIQAQEALRQSQKLEAMGQLTGGVAHDFNNLLTPIVGSLDMLVRRELGNERERRLIDGALQSAERAKTLVQRLLAFARRQPLQPVAVDLPTLVDGMAGLIGSTLGPRIEIRVELEPDLPPASADPNQLEMAILNLGVNARDAMPEGGRLTIAAARSSVALGDAAPLPPGDYVRLSVADTGCGMDEATLVRAIEPFFSTKGVGKGTGLGLSMAHGLAAQLGGGLVIDSAPGKGTTVALWLPVSASPLGAEDRARMEPLRRRRMGRALLVDDEELARMSTADMLTDLGYDVVEANSAEAALDAIRGGARPDLLVTDYLMPGMNGSDLAREVRALHPGLPVLLVSGYAEVDGVAPDLPRLTKPFRQADLAAIVATLGV